MDFLRIGPDGLLLVHGVIMSALLAFLTWRRVSLAPAALTATAGALALVAWEVLALGNDVNHPILTLLFVLAPSALLFWVSRAGWMSRRAWVLVLLGPIVFVVGYVGICTCAFRLGALAAA